MLVSTGVLEQVGEDHVVHTEQSKVYRDFHPSGVMFQMQLVSKFFLVINVAKKTV